MASRLVVGLVVLAGLPDLIGMALGHKSWSGLPWTLVAVAVLGVVDLGPVRLRAMDGRIGFIYVMYGMGCFGVPVLMRFLTPHGTLGPYYAVAGLGAAAMATAGLRHFVIATGRARAR